MEGSSGSAGSKGMGSRSASASATTNQNHLEHRGADAATGSTGTGGMSLLMLQLILLKLLAIVFTLSAICVTLTSNQNVLVYNIPFSVRYSYSSAYKFMVVANAIVCGMSLSSVICIWVVGKNISQPDQLPLKLFCLLLHDLVMMVVMTAGCGAASAIGMVGYNGIDEIGWVAICDNVPNFCHKMIAAVVLSYLSMLTYLALTLLSAFKLATSAD
ncbi:CASP-like protein 1F2 [Linum perenne]